MVKRPTVPATQRANGLNGLTGPTGQPIVQDRTRHRLEHPVSAAARQ